jgi:hypothetical protein
LGGFDFEAKGSQYPGYVKIARHTLSILPHLPLKNTLKTLAQIRIDTPIGVKVCIKRRELTNLAAGRS